jgi:hypothetical protein
VALTVFTVDIDLEVEILVLATTTRSTAAASKEPLAAHSVTLMGLHTLYA